jgi:hypothetical protein
MAVSLTFPLEIDATWVHHDANRKAVETSGVNPTFLPNVIESSSVKCSEISSHSYQSASPNEAKDIKYELTRESIN